MARAHPGCRRPALGSQRGSVLLLVMFLALLYGALTLSMLSITTADTEEVYNHRRHTRALAIAEAGIEHAISELRADAAWQAGISSFTFPPASDGAYTVTVDNSGYPLVDLVSTGAVDGCMRRIEATVEVSGPPEDPPFPVRIEAWIEP